MYEQPKAFPIEDKPRCCVQVPPAVQVQGGGSAMAAEVSISVSTNGSASVGFYSNIEVGPSSPLTQQRFNFSRTTSIRISDIALREANDRPDNGENSVIPSQIVKASNTRKAWGSSMTYPNEGASRT